MRRVVVGFVGVVMGTVVSLASTGLSAAPAGGARAGAGGTGSLEPELLEDLEGSGNGRDGRYVVELAATADLGPAARVRGQAARTGAVVRSLQSTAGGSQRRVLETARQVEDVTAAGYWLTNVVVVRGGDADLAKRLAALPGVTRVRRERRYPLVEPVRREAVEAAAVAAAADPEWGVAKIGADQAWAEGVLGSGVVVANIDTGVDFTHPALAGQYRGNLGGGGFAHDYNWWDPTGICGATPCDNVEHGTHTMGTMVGGDGPGPFTPDIGVAPGARWIAAKGCEEYYCSETSLLSSGQWVLAPTDLEGNNPDPSKRPDIVSNSWGGGPGDSFYLETVQAWRAAGIIPVFSAGNPGPFCGEGGSPGDYVESFSAGATDVDDVIADFSGRGPSSLGKVNPDVAAPGVDVTSSVPGGGYASFDGTSMAAPHVAGALALLISAEPALAGDFDGATTALRDTAVDLIDESCGGDEDGDPNNVYGDGRIDAHAAVQLVATGGTLTGRVTDGESGTPISGARLTAQGPDREFGVWTDADGRYRLFLAAGTYVVRAEAFGYDVGTVSGVEIETDATVIQDFALSLLPQRRVSGQVRAAEDGRPLGRVEVRAVGTPVAPTHTDRRGRYSLTLPVGSYTLRATAGGCSETGLADVTLGTEGPARRNFSLFRKLDDAGHGCRPIGFEWSSGETDSALFGNGAHGRLRLPFPFGYYGESHDFVYFTDDGYLAFEPPPRWDDYVPPFEPAPIPSEDEPNAAVYVLGQNLEIGPDAMVRYGVIGETPERAFVIEWAHVSAPGSRSTVDLAARLWEDGRIDLLYGENPANPGDGRGALVGIENADGTDALQFSLREALIGSPAAYRFEQVPTGSVTGTVVDRNDGAPLAGATVTAEPGGRTARTAADGSFRLRLRPGRYDLQAATKGYETGDVGPLWLRADQEREVAFALAAPAAAVSPEEISRSVVYGSTAAATLTLSNVGSAPLAWRAVELARSETPVELPPAPDLRRSRTWRTPRPPAGQAFAPTEALPPDALEPVIDDPEGDSTGTIDVTRVLGGSDGVDTTVRLEFAPGVPMTEMGGYLMFDVDQDPATGLPPEWLFGDPDQDVGVEFYATLFDLGFEEPVVILWDQYDEFVAEVPATLEESAVTFSLPLAAMDGDDGTANVALVVGIWGPEDFAPDAGHGTIEPAVDAAWLTPEPTEGSIAPGESVDVELGLGTPELLPGTYRADLRFLTDAPKQGALTVPVTLEVTVPDGWGAVAGTVTDATGGAPLAAEVTVHAVGGDRSTTADGAGAYTLFAPAGTWSTDYAFDGYETVTRDVEIVAGSLRRVDVALRFVQPHAALTAPPIDVSLPEGESTTVTLELANPEGLVPLEVAVGEAPVVAGPGVTTARRTNAVAPELASFDAGTAHPWGVAVDPTGRVLVVDADEPVARWFTGVGRAAGEIPTPADAGYGADAAYDATRSLVWLLAVGEESTIVGLDPVTGAVVDEISGDWSEALPRGLAHDPVTDVFYVGGGSDKLVHRVAGPSWEDPGDDLHSCEPYWVFRGIAGLGWNSARGLLWASTRGWGEYIAALDPETCEHVWVVAPPETDWNTSSGLEVDPVGNLWWSSQATGRAYLLEVPEHLQSPADVEWLSAEPTDLTIAPDGAAAIEVTVTAEGTGVQRASLVIETNDPDHRTFSVPVTVRVED